MATIRTIEEILEELDFVKISQEELQLEVKPILDKIQRLVVHREGLYSELQKVCTHPSDRNRVHKSYMSGGYDYQATSTTTTDCGVCGKLLDEKVTFHGFE